MSRLILNVGQALAGLCVLFALGRGIADASQPQTSEWAFRKTAMEAGKLEGKLAAMAKSPDKSGRQELVAKIAKLYADAGMYSKAEPFALVALASAKEMGGNSYAAALMKSADFYQDWHDSAKSQFLSLRAVSKFEEGREANAVCKAYLAMTRSAYNQGEAAVDPAVRDNSFVSAEQWLGKAVAVARREKLNADTLNLMRNTMLLLSVAEGRTEEVMQSLKQS